MRTGETMELYTRTPQPILQPVERLVTLVTNDQQFGEFLAHQISHFGYYVQIANDLKDLRYALNESSTTAILVDLPALDKGMTNDKVFEGIKEFRHSSLPIMFISSRDDQKTRLDAIRAGGTAFFSKPLDTVSLIDRLDSLTSTEAADPYRVLVVDDQAAIADYYKTVLNMAGMEALVITDATKVLQQMVELSP